MKKIVRHLSLLGCASTSIFAAPFLAIGDNAELFLTATASSSYNDNVLLQPSGNEESDLIFSFTPGFDLQFGRGSLIEGNVIGSTTLSGYANDPSKNSQVYGISSTASYNSGGLLKLGANASYQESDTPTIDVLSNTNRSTTSAGINGSMPLFGKTGVSSGVSYSRTEYDSPVYNDEFSYSVPVNITYELTPKVSVSTGVTYTRTEIDANNAGIGENKYNAFYYNVGASGAFTQKLSGHVSIGYNTRSADVGPDENGSIGANMSLDYSYSEKTQLGLALSRDFSNAARGGASYENTQLSLHGSNAISVDWSVNASLTYRYLDYQTGAVDQYVESSLGATYIINNHLNSNFGYTYSKKFSDSGTSNEFQNNVITVSLSARY